MTEIELLESALKKARELRSKFDAEIRALERKVSDYHSYEFIRVNGIKKANVLVEPDNVIHMNFIQFGQWVRENLPSGKTFCVWNTQLHYCQKAACRYFEPTPAYIEHVKE